MLEIKTLFSASATGFGNLSPVDIPLHSDLQEFSQVIKRIRTEPEPEAKKSPKRCIAPLRAIGPRTGLLEVVAHAAPNDTGMWAEPNTAGTEVLLGTRVILFVTQVLYEQLCAPVFVFPA